MKTKSEDLSVREPSPERPSVNQSVKSERKTPRKPRPPQLESAAHEL